MTCRWTWKTRAGHRTAHAFAHIDLAAGFPVLEPMGCTQRFKVDRLTEVERGHRFRCPGCLAATGSRARRRI
ncbi:hypothetical protein JOF56_010502 [Kibdelosporangium banguiense]|uniref:Uncharacterized protein n=1 Tax=Kibdelosporangium banguiense TaxID=1365924 RepID=A0ABS4U0E5_9PSEU|nr:hypothetical protein [Kibdelosporangium banguiense]